MRTIVVLVGVMCCQFGCARPLTDPADKESPPARAEAPPPAKPPVAKPPVSPPPVASDEDSTDRPVVVRLVNATDTPWVDASLRGGSFRTFGSLDVGATSSYQPFRSLRASDTLALFEIGGGLRERRVEARATEERIAPARYTWTVTLREGVPETQATRDGPLTPEAAKEALRYADRRLTAGRAQAWLYENRAQTEACGAATRGLLPVEASLVIAPSGRTGGVTFQGGGLAESDKACVSKVLTGMRFPPYSGAMEPPRSYVIPLGPLPPKRP